MRKEVITIIISTLMVSGIVYGVNYIGNMGMDGLEESLGKREAIIRLFAEKYSLDESDINITINQDSESHVIGSIELSPGGPTNMGAFLAARVDGQWEIVFDGNGTVSCERLIAYNFPEEMLGYCYEPAAKTRMVKEGETFSILLESNPSTGYGWDVVFDARYLELVGQDFILSSPDSMVGAGGLEEFTFKALGSGVAKIEFSYLRSWEGEVIDSEVYEITIQ